MADTFGTDDGFVVMPEIVCTAIPEIGAAADLRTLTSTQLIDLVQSGNGALSQADLPAIMSIAQERLAASHKDAEAAGQLLQACRGLGAPLPS